MINQTASKRVAIIWPDYITSNVYFWKPGKNAHYRLNNKTQKELSFYDFIRSYGFVHDPNTNTFKKWNCGITFFWNESCKKVYRTFDVYINGKKSNRRGAEKFMHDNSGID